MSPATVQRILAALVLKPHRWRYFLTRTDPLFEEKMAEILDSICIRPGTVAFSVSMRRPTSKPWNACIRRCPCVRAWLSARNLNTIFCPTIAIRWAAIHKIEYTERTYRMTTQHGMARQKGGYYA